MDGTPIQAWASHKTGQAASIRPDPTECCRCRCGNQLRFSVIEGGCVNRPRSSTKTTTQINLTRCTKRKNAMVTQVGVRSRAFRISGSNMIMRLYGAAAPAVEPYFRRRPIPWTINGQTVYYWLTRAELCKINPSFMSVTDSSLKNDQLLCKTVKGARSIHSNHPDDQATYDSMKGYIDLPNKGGSQNPFISLCERPFPLTNTTFSPAVLQSQINSMIARINNEPWLPPDDDCTLDDSLNDKRNLRGLLYLAFLIWRNETLTVVGSGLNISPLPQSSRDMFRQLFNSKKTLNYPELSRIAQNTMIAAGITAY